MNHIYKVIWNTITQTWVAVSELSRAKGKTKSSKTLSAVVLAAVSARAIVGGAEAAMFAGQGDGISIQSQKRNTKVAKAEGVTAIAIGYDVSSKGTSALAIGTQTHATGEKTVAIGHLSTATGSESAAFGVNATAKGNGDIALGKHAVAQGGANGVTGSAALGDEAKATGAQSAAVGGKSNASGSHAVASGYNTQATGGSSSAIGDAAEASGNQATAVGVSSEAKGNQSAALGMAAHAHGSGSVAAGVSSQATEEGTTAIGGWTEAKAQKATAVGDSAHANANRATALGHDSQATGEFSTATGVSSRASGLATVATGKSAKASGSNAIATGNAANATGTDSIASGRQASATGTGAVATGADASASGNAAAYGNKAKATGGWSSAFGNEAKATQSDASAFGNSANAGAQNATAVGAHSSVTASGGTALGRGSSVAATDGVALGNGAVADRAARDRNTIVINTADPSKTAGLSDNNNGGNANTVYAPVHLVDAPEALTKIKETIKGNKGAVSVGDSKNTRQIINVAAGSADSDAVNVAQLKAVAGSIKKYQVTSPDGSINITNPTPGQDPQNFQISMNTTAVQNAAAWNLKEGSENGNGEQVKGGNTVTFTDTETIDVVRTGKTLKFNAKVSSIKDNEGGNEGKPWTTDNGGQYLAKTKNVVDAIRNSGWTLQANGQKVGLVNPGDKVNIATDANSGITITPTNENAGISTIKLKANVTGLTAGKNVTISSKDGNYTITATDTNTQASVSKKSGSPITVTKTATNPNSPDYAIGLDIDDKTLEIKNGRLAAKAQAQAIESVEKKAGDDNIAEVGVKSGSTKGAANAVYTVAVTKSAVKDAAAWNIKEGSETTSASVKGGDTLTLSDTNTIDVVRNGKDFIFNAKTANIQTEQKQAVTRIDLSDTGITTKTTGGNNTPTGRFVVPTGNDADKHALATAYDVADKVNQTGWNLYSNGGSPILINPGDYVNFKSGKATNATIVTEASEGATISYDVNVDNATIKIDPNGNKLTANTGDIDAVTSTEGNSKKGQVTIHKDPLVSSKTDSGKLATVDTVVKAVNNATWYAKAGNDKDAEVSEDDTKADETANKSAAMKAGEILGLKAGKNLRVKRDGTNFTFALNNVVDLTNAGSLTIGNTKVDNGGITITPTTPGEGKTAVKLTGEGLNNGGNKIVNVAEGTKDNDAVNYKQLKDSISTETVRKADVTNGDNNIVEVDPTAETGKGTQGATYNISVKESAVKNIAKTAVKVVDGKNTTVTAKDNTSDNSKTYAVNVKGDLTDITSITNTTGSGKVEFAGDGVVNITDGNNTGNHPIKLDGKTGDITGLTNTTLGGTNFAKSGRAATEEQLDIVNKKFDNKVSLGGNTGETTKKALSTPNGIKFNVKSADGNKVVTTEATGDDVNIKFSGEEAAKVIDLKYKSNNDETKAKTVKLSNGLDFTNGTHTTAEVGDNGVVKFNVNTAKVDVPTTQPTTFTGKFDAPTTDGVATIKNVVDVVNNSGWKISQGTESRGIVKAGDEVSFANGDGTNVSVETDATNPNKRIVKVNATLKEAAKGTIVAVTENGTGDNAPKKGQVKANTGDDNKVTTVKNVADMINSAKWFAKADNSEEDLAETKNDNGEAVNAGSELTFKAGKNLHVNRTNGVFTFALNNAVNLTNAGSLTIGETKVNNDGITITPTNPGEAKTAVTLTANGLDNGKNKIVNVAAGKDDTDAVNVKQLKETELHIAPTKANGEASGVTYTYDDKTKSVTLKYKDGNGKVIENTEAKIDLSGLASKIKDYSFKTNATGSNLVGTGTDTTVASGKSVNFAASDNLTLKQDVNNGNVTYTYGLKNQVVVGEKGTPGADGKPGKDGVDGSIGVNGKNGSAVAINGKDGSIDLNGKDGKNGLTIKGQDGKVGVDGKDGETRLVYVEKADPTKPGSSDKPHELATLDDGMKYGGDIGEVANVKLNKQVDVKGGVTDRTKLSDNNIGVVSTPNATTGGTELTVKLAKELKGLTSAEFKGGDDSAVTNITNSGITIKPANSNDDSKTVSLTDTGLNNGGNKITNVAEGENDTDAVNVKQLKDFKTKVADGGLTFVGNSGTAYKAKLNTTVNIKGGKDNTDATQFDNGKNVMTTVNNDTVTVSIKKTPEVEGINITDTTGNVKVKLTQTNEGLKVSDGNNNATHITNIKAGEKDTDAVNVKQLKAAKTEVEAGDDHIDVKLTTGANGQTIYKVSAKGINDTSAEVKAGSNYVEVTKAANTHKDGSTTVTDYTVDLSKETKDDIKKGVDAHTEVTTKGLTFNADKGSTGVKKLGSKVAVNGDGKNITTTADENGVKVSMKDDIKVNSVTAKEVKVGDVNINENGINAGGKRITNVAPGKDGTDAVNVNQLKYVAGNINNQINNVDKGLRAGIAGALASGGLYHVTTAGKSMVSVGAGTYRGQNALAVGYSRLSDNGKVGVKFTVNSNSQGHAGASASVGYQW